MILRPLRLRGSAARSGGSNQEVATEDSERDAEVEDKTEYLEGRGRTRVRRSADELKSLDFCFIAPFLHELLVDPTVAVRSANLECDGGIKLPRTVPAGAVEGRGGSKYV